jgi:methionyl aminopeptidase
MSIQDAAAVEGTKAYFSVEKFHKTREKAQEAVSRIVAQVQVGMLEEDANSIVVATLQEMGSTEAFHTPYIRFGTNTVKTFGADSDPGIRLGEDDIFFIDVGPVWDGYEGDAGETFLTGNNPDLKRCALDAQKIFQAVAEKWKTETSSTGEELYQYADQMAQKLGWELNFDLGGHRLGDYPSGDHYAGPLSEITFHPSPNRWMVEIHIRHPDHLFGAFYEDLLIGEESVKVPEIAIQEVPAEGSCGGY